MLSRLSSLSVFSLRELEEQADRILYHDPLYNTASLVESYARHVLRPHIDAESQHKRYFLKLLFINKGIDFINLQSIFQNKNITKAIPSYFKNLEPPMICYKYKKPVRTFIFNYNKIVSDLNIHDNTPSNCDCSSSKFCYAPAGHVITGDFNIIKDKRIRSLLKKGPKYRLPSLVDFDKCREIITEALHTFTLKWCRREHADFTALKDWYEQILDIVDTRITFYKANTHLLPPKPKVSYRYLKKGFQDFHSKYVFVPADKASNNVIII